MSVIVGAASVAETEIGRASCREYGPTLTFTLIVADPDCLATCLNFTVRLDPLPPKTMLLVGASVALDEPWLSVRLPTGVSASPTVNGIAAVAVSTVVN